MRWREVLARMLPWAPKSERRAAIAAAAAEAEASRAGREHARAVEQEIRRLARQNHYVQIIADEIIRGHRHGGR